MQQGKILAALEFLFLAISLLGQSVFMVIFYIQTSVVIFWLHNAIHNIPMVVKKTNNKKEILIYPTNHKAEEGLYMVSRVRQEFAGLLGKVRNQNIWKIIVRRETSCSRTQDYHHTLGHHWHLFDVLAGLSKPQSVRPQKSPGQEAATSVSP